MSSEKVDYDVVIIGGGPGGSSTAYYSAINGLKVVLFEKEKYPRDKPCGGALSVRNLQLIGKKAMQAINCEIANIMVYSPTLNSFINRTNKGYYVIRTEFDAALAEDAKEQGADVFDDEGVQKIDLLENGKYLIKTEKREVTSTYVVMATGVASNSLIRSLGIRKKWAEGYLAMCVNSETKIDNNALKKINVNETSLRIFFGVVPKGYGWYFVKDGYLNIGIGATWLNIKDKGPKNVYNDFIKQLREINLLPDDLQLESSKSHTLVFKKTAKKTVFGNVLVVGDAAGFVSPVTGEGMYYAIASGKYAAEAIARNKSNGKSLSYYEKLWKKDFGRDLNIYGYFLQKTLYKTLGRMELVVKLAIADSKLADLTSKMIFGILDYGLFIYKVLWRLPVSIFKLLFKKK